MGIGRNKLKCVRVWISERIDDSENEDTVLDDNLRYISYVALSYRGQVNITQHWIDQLKYVCPRPW